MPRISIISPCYNVEKTSRPAASQDGTVAILRRLAADPCVKVIVNSRNFGPFRSNSTRSAKALPLIAAVTWWDRSRDKALPPSRRRNRTAAAGSGARDR
jgi:hypothetical protein